jgi:hypothetical protein
MVKFMLAWVPMLLIAIGNGALREGWYGKYLGDLRAHQVSTATGVVLLGVYMWVLIRFWRPDSSGQALAVGLMWLGLTVAFEFVFRRCIRGLAWSSLMHDYNIFAGRVWVVVLLWVAAAPYVFYRLQEQ